MTSDITLESQGAIHVRGADAIAFLQGQLTADVTRLVPGVAQLAAYSTPQGRVIALLRLAPHADGVLALLPRALAEPVVERLRRYVLRARLTLRVTEEMAFVGLAADTGGAADAAHAAAHAGALRLRGRGRDLLVAPRDSLAALLATDAALAATVLAPAAWRAAGIAAGDPEVEPEASEEWVPQMLNLDLLDAISFTKGCYTGQEIVARTQHLGRIKRRMFRYRTQDASLAPKAPLFLDGAKVGEVVTGARTGAGLELLAVVALEARDQALATAAGETCLPAAVPYVVP